MAARAGALDLCSQQRKGGTQLVRGVRNEFALCRRMQFRATLKKPAFSPTACR